MRRTRGKIPWKIISFEINGRLQVSQEISIQKLGLVMPLATVVLKLFGPSRARLHERADQAIVVSNAAYTKAARQLAGTTGVILLHHDDLVTFGGA